MKKLVINENQLGTLKNLLFEAKIGKALPKLAIDDFLLITNKSGEQVKYTVLMNMATVVYFKTIQKKTNKSFFVWLSVTSIGEDNTLEIRSLEDHPRNSKKIKHPDTWATTTLKDISGIEVFDKDKNPKFKIDVDDNPGDDHTTDELQPKPNQDYIDGKVDRDGKPISKPKTEPDAVWDKPQNNNIKEPESEELSKEELISVIKDSKFLSNVMKKQPHMVRGLKRGDEEILDMVRMVVSNYEDEQNKNKPKPLDKSSGKSNNVLFIDKFKVNDIVRIELMDNDYQFGSNILDIGREYDAVVKKRRVGDGVLLRIVDTEMIIKLFSEIKPNLYDAKIRLPDSKHEENRKIKVDNRI